MTQIDCPSPNHDARARGAIIDMLVLHYTGMRTADEALARLCDPAAKVSAHYTITRDGGIYAHMPEGRRAWHAGVSFWHGARDINSRSIGIELVNPGHEFGYIPFTDEQMEALTGLSREILARHPIPARNVVGHSDIAPARKEDPGELFPWQMLARNGIGLWPSLRDEEVSADCLSKYGYDTEAPREKTILAFQRHFRPANLTGEWDAKCGRLLAGLTRETTIGQLRETG